MKKLFTLFFVIEMMTFIGLHGQTTNAYDSVRTGDIYKIGLIPTEPDSTLGAGNFSYNKNTSPEVIIYVCIMHASNDSVSGKVFYERKSNESTSYDGYKFIKAESFETATIGWSNCCQYSVPINYYTKLDHLENDLLLPDFSSQFCLGGMPLYLARFTNTDSWALVVISKVNLFEMKQIYPEPACKKLSRR